MRTRGVLAALIVLALVAACGDAQPWPHALQQSGSPRARLLAAVKRTSKESSARVSMSVRAAGFGKEQRVTASGAADFAHNRMALTLRDSQDASHAAEMRILGKTMYVRDGNDPWQKLSIDTPDASKSSLDPTQYLDYLREIAPDVHVVGTETVRGATTTHYKASLDLGRMLDKSGASASERKNARAALHLLGSDAAKLPVGVWIDTEGRVRKLSLSIAVAGAAVSAVVEIWDYGVHVEVQAPDGAHDLQAKARNLHTQSDLRSALTAEKVVYTDHERYTTRVATLKDIEPSLDWGGALTVVVGDAVHPGDHGVVCLSERSKSGTTFAIADVATGSRGGSYEGTGACPARPTPANVAALGTRW